jgi:hypothetical protein
MRLGVPGRRTRADVPAQAGVQADRHVDDFATNGSGERGLDCAWIPACARMTAGPG